MRNIAKVGVMALGAVGLWQVLGRLRGVPEAIDPIKLILNPDEAQREGRMLPHKSIANLRDVGGYSTMEGKTVRWNRVYRGASLVALTEDDAKGLAERGLKIVCDLRMPTEAADAPDIMPHESVRYVTLPFKQSSDRLTQLRILLFQRQKLADTLRQTYTRVMIDNNPAVIGDFLRLVAEEDNLPLLVHCSAGKDRTGVVIAVLLRLLGVPEQTVLEDYSLSNLYYDYFINISAKIIKQLGVFRVSEAEVRPLFLADPATLKTTLDYIEAKYGSVEEYVTTHTGVTPEMVARIRANLLE
jgi:protein-tyrosine phosphatase